MSKRYIGYTQSGRKSLYGLRGVFPNKTLLMLEPDEVAIIEQDFTDVLGSGETLSGVTSSDANVTPSVSGAKATSQFTPTNSDITLLATLSTGEKISETIQVRQRNVCPDYDYWYFP